MCILKLIFARFASSRHCDDHNFSPLNFNSKYCILGRVDFPRNFFHELQSFDSAHFHKWTPRGRPLGVVETFFCFRASSMVSVPATFFFSELYIKHWKNEAIENSLVCFLWNFWCFFSEKNCCFFPCTKISKMLFPEQGLGKNPQLLTVCVVFYFSIDLEQ